MIQKFEPYIKSIFNNYTLSYNKPLTVNEFQYLETHLLHTLHTSPYHYHNDELCSSPQFKHTHSYTRNYITFKDHKIIEERVTIPVLYCRNDEHYHALLPLAIMIPYCQYSFSFIVSVIFDKHYSTLTVNDIVDKYHISKSTLYRWLEKYHYYLHYYYQLRSRYDCSFSISLLYLWEELSNDIFDICGLTIFQYNRKLAKPPS
jgi:hypothetical protein